MRIFLLAIEKLWIRTKSLCPGVINPAQNLENLKNLELCPVILIIIVGLVCLQGKLTCTFQDTSRLVSTPNVLSEHKGSVLKSLTALFPSQSGGDQERKHKRRRGEYYSIPTSLIIAALKKMLPIGLNMCTPGDQELISVAKKRYSLVSF